MTTKNVYTFPIIQQSDNKQLNQDNKQNDSDTDNTNPSLCIPRILENVNQRDIRAIFDKLKLGNINRIDVVERRTDKGEQYKRAFIHFNNWYTDESTINIKQRLVDGKDIKIVYNNPWFWKVSINKWHKS